MGISLRFGTDDALRVEALLWQRASALPDLQLLPEATLFQIRSCKAGFCAGAGARAAQSGIPPAWLCGDAGTRSSADERTAAGNALHGDARFEIACGQKTQGGKKEVHRSRVRPSYRSHGARKRGVSGRRVSTISTCTPRA